MASLGKVGVADEVLEMGNRLAAAMERLADELHTYNHPPVEVAGMGTFSTHRSPTIEVPPGAGDYEISEGEVKHRYSKVEPWHYHVTPASFMQCLTDKGIL